MMRSAALLATRSIRARHVSVRSFSGLAQIDPSRLDIRKTGTRKLFPAKEDLVFGQLFADHMLEVDWTAEHGWHAPVIKPYGPFAMDPASSSLHYGLQCFEGMKAYVDADDNIRLFRPDMNMARLKVSSGRMNLPDFDGDAFLECIKELVRATSLAWSVWPALSHNSKRSSTSSPIETISLSTSVWEMVSRSRNSGKSR